MNLPVQALIATRVACKSVLRALNNLLFTKESNAVMCELFACNKKDEKI